MKRCFLALQAAAILLFATSCGNRDFIEVTPPTKGYSKASSEEIAENVQKVFGVAFDANQDWNMLQNRTVAITANADLSDVAKVRVMAIADGEMTTLNEVAAKKGDRVEISFDAPVALTRLFAACVSKDGSIIYKGFNTDQTEVTFSATNKAAKRRSFEDRINIDLPVLVSHKASFNNTRAHSSNAAYAVWQNSNWNDQLYYQDEDNVLKAGLQNIAVEELADDEKSDLQTIISSFLPYTIWRYQVRYNNNYDDRIIVSDGLFSYRNTHLTTTGTAPVLLAPVYHSGELGNCGLFYYYFKPEDQEASGLNEVDYIKQLPKYQLAASPYADTKQTVTRRYLYAVAYYGDEAPTDGMQARSFIFPEGYKIGFVLRNWKRDGGGELYGDGRLNTEINQYKSFAYPKFADIETSRIVAFGANNKDYLCFEDGADQDFDDLIIEVESGVKKMEHYDMDMQSRVYTFAFEDRDLGDYDMNDIVIKAQRIDETHVKYSLEAVGAHDQVFVCVKNGTLLNGSQEVHAMFNVPQSSFVNTVSGEEYIEPIQEIVEVDKFFSFSRPEDQPFIYNKSSRTEIHIATKGEDPHGILVPTDWQYPLERICVGGADRPAYKQFNNWGADAVTSTDWYVHPVADRVYTKSSFKTE